MKFQLLPGILHVTEFTESEIGRMVRIELAIIKRLGHITVGPRSTTQSYAFKQERWRDVYDVLRGFQVIVCARCGVDITDSDGKAFTVCGWCWDVEHQQTPSGTPVAGRGGDAGMARRPPHPRRRHE